MTDQLIVRIPTILIVVTLIILEFLIPRKSRIYSRLFRWFNNILILLFNTIIVSLIKFFPIALLSVIPSVGLLYYLKLHTIIELVFCLCILDLGIYFQHRLFHKFDLLWKLHRMHHTDRDLDFSSALRFHPFEIILSMAIKLTLSWLLGITAGTLALFEILINIFAIFNHSNIYIPLTIDRLLRRVIITPDMHRIHHSVYRDECNSNYGTILSLWDYLFKSYVKEPLNGHIHMKLGVPGYRDKKYQKINWMLITPFIKE